MRHSTPIDYICKICREHIVCKRCIDEKIRREHIVCYRCMGLEKKTLDDGSWFSSEYIKSFDEALK